jgi:hypothetical protein
MRTLSLALTFSLALFTFAPEGHTATKPEAGDYLETRFIETLKKTRSIVAADKACNDLMIAQVLSVIERPRGFDISQSENWHEGQNLFELLRNGKIRNGHDNNGETTIEISNPHHITIRTAGVRQDANFVYVGDAAKFIQHNILVGKYIDDAHQRYEFKDDGTGRFSNKPISYSLNLADFPDDSFSAVGRVIAFRWNGAELTLYPMIPPESDAEGYGTPDLNHPITHLHQVH